MRASLALTIRLGVLLAFLVLMPVLAVPQVNRWVDERFLGVLTPENRSVERTKGSELAAKKNEVSSTNPAARGALSASNEKSLEFVRKNESPAIATPATDANAGSAQTRIERVSLTSNDVNNAQFQQLQGRLQRLGVQYLVLEKWPGATTEYRFHCRMPVPGSSAYARPFEARDADPLRAMQLVLNDVESWCACHSMTTSTKLR